MYFCHSIQTLKINKHNEFTNLGRMMDMVKAGKDANEAIKEATGTYGRFNDAAKYIDPRKE